MPLLVFTDIPEELMLRSAGRAEQRAIRYNLAV